MVQFRAAVGAASRRNHAVPSQPAARLGLTPQKLREAVDDDDGDEIDVNGDGYDTTQVESDADEASGASSSPVWGYWSGKPYAIGVHHGVEQDGTISGTQILSCASGGDGFTAAAQWGRGHVVLKPPAGRRARFAWRGQCATV